ncbi:unnamed protein product [Caenorhabditis brenneri]
MGSDQGQQNTNRHPKKSIMAPQSWLNYYEPRIEVDGGKLDRSVKSCEILQLRSDAELKNQKLVTETLVHLWTNVALVRTDE